MLAIPWCHFWPFADDRQRHKPRDLGTTHANDNDGLDHDDNDGGSDDTREQDMDEPSVSGLSSIFRSFQVAIKSRS